MNRSIVLVALLVVLAPFVHAQRYYRGIAPFDNVITIRTGNGRVSARFLPKAKRVSLDEVSWYHWYKNGRLHRTQGAYDGRLLHGEYTASYENGSLKEKGMFTYGLKDKKWYQWDENGTLRKVSRWKLGKEMRIIYDSSGDLKTRLSPDSSKMQIQRFEAGKKVEGWKAGWLRRTYSRIRDYL